MLATDPVSILKFAVSDPMDMFCWQKMLVVIEAKPILDLDITEMSFSWLRFYSIHYKQDLEKNYSSPIGSLTNSNLSTIFPLFFTTSTNQAG